jgi:hypothetical protein
MNLVIPLLKEKEHRAEFNFLPDDPALLSDRLDTIRVYFRVNEGRLCAVATTDQAIPQFTEESYALFLLINQRFESKCSDETFTTLKKILSSTFRDFTKGFKS